MKDIDTFIALNRFGLGVEPEEPRGDPRAWLLGQIRPGKDQPAAFRGLPGSAEILGEIHAARHAGPERLRQVTGNHYRKTFAPEIVARAQHHITTKKPFAERLVLFWSNHFTVSRTKLIVGPALPAFEREAIRPNIFGRFEDLLAAVASHTAMVSYLDNNLSIGPNSMLGQRTGRSINENLAREILELHTLGVDGGYSQADVTEFAKALTGWTHKGMVGPRMPAPTSGAFIFRRLFHEPGPKTVLGATYRQRGFEQGRAILHDLARHPATAQFIAAKLVRHFVDDDPPKRAVQEIARVFRETDGDLARISAALIELDEVWANPLPKVKTPYELLISASRALGVKRVGLRGLRGPLQSMAHEPFNAPSPQGWPDLASHWMAPEALMRRIEWVRAVSVRIEGKVRPGQLLERTIGPVASRETREMVDLAPSADAGVALVLASAEFQRR